MAFPVDVRDRHAQDEALARAVSDDLSSRRVTLPDGIAILGISA
jgi:hypothetical protein